MEITWLGHSSLRLVSRDIVLITDPYPDSIGFSMGDQQAEVVTVSNDHPNHSSIDSVGGDPRVLKGPGQYEVKGYNFNGMATRLPESEGDKRINTVFTIRAEGLTLCHLGDLNDRLGPGQLDALGNIDVLMVPAGGGCTIEVGDVPRLVSVLSPRIVIPMHYGYESTAGMLAPVERLLTELSVEDASPQIRLNVTQTNLPRETQVVLLRKAS